MVLVGACVCLCAVLYVERMHADVCACLCARIGCVWVSVWVPQCMYTILYVCVCMHVVMHGGCLRVWMCVNVYACAPQAYAQVGVHESDCVFGCVCACVSAHVNACARSSPCPRMCIHGCVCDHVVISYYVVCGCVHDVDACGCVWLWTRKAACMCV